VEYRIVYTKQGGQGSFETQPGSEVKGKGNSEEICQDAFGARQKMVDPAFGTYRFRIGDYRAIFDIEGSDLVILRIGHRRDIYRR
jgi:mRNA interferase RelE/StbE